MSRPDSSPISEQRAHAGGLRQRLIPLMLFAVIVVVDQITKAVIVATVPRIESSGYVIEVLGEFLRIIHTRNLGIAFSLGRNLEPGLRQVLFIALPTVVVVLLGVFYIRSDEFTPLQRWAVAGILGGGVGNLIDRVFRADGVVDFVDVKFYGLFGLERWPTFNVADASVVVCGILLVLGMFLEGRSQS